MYLRPGKLMSYGSYCSRNETTPEKYLHKEPKYSEDVETGNKVHHPDMFLIGQNIIVLHMWHILQSWAHIFGNIPIVIGRKHSTAWFWDNPTIMLHVRSDKNYFMRSVPHFWMLSLIAFTILHHISLS